MDKQFVMKFGSIGDDFVYYRIACDCASENCDMSLSMERDEEYDRFYINIDKKLRASVYWNSVEEWLKFDWVRVLKNKLLMCWKILTTGYIEVSESFIIKEEEHAQQFIDALVEGRDFLIETKQKKESNDVKE